MSEERGSTGLDLHRCISRGHSQEAATMPKCIWAVSGPHLANLFYHYSLVAIIIECLPSSSGVLEKPWSRVEPLVTRHRPDTASRCTLCHPKCCSRAPQGCLRRNSRVLRVLWSSEHVSPSRGRLCGAYWPVFGHGRSLEGHDCHTACGNRRTSLKSRCLILQHCVSTWRAMRL